MSPRRLPRWVFLGVLVAQVAWILALAPFDGADEFEHVYRAEAVVHGEWVAHGVPPDGRGGLVTVPQDVAQAAHAACSDLPYTTASNCSPVADAAGGMVRIASAASRYNPVFYAVVGAAGLAFDGAGADYAMRVAAALVCALGIAAAAWSLSLRRQPAWPLLGLLVSLTPEVVYTTSLPAPNGLEMVAALVLWCTLLSLEDRERAGDRRLIVLACAAGCLLLSLRSLGPVLGLMILVTVVLHRRRQVPAIWRAHRRRLTTALVACAAAGVGSLAWILGQSSLGTADGSFAHDRYSTVWSVVPAGLLQGVAAAPRRNDGAPIVVYAVVLGVLLALLVLVVRRARGHGALAVVGVVVATQVLALVVSALGLHTVGLAWQGRYGLPYLVGASVLAGVALAAAQVRPPSRRVLAPVVVAVAAVQVVATCAVASREAGRPRLVADGGWWQLPPWVVGLVAATGWLILAGVAMRAAGSGAPGTSRPAAPSDPASAGTRTPVTP